VQQLCVCLMYFPGTLSSASTPVGSMTGSSSALGSTTRSLMMEENNAHSPISCACEFPPQYLNIMDV
jgi:hypothetical protein